MPTADDFIRFAMDYQQAAIIIVDFFFVVKVTLHYSADAAHKIGSHAWNGRKRWDQHQIVHILLWS